MASQDESPTIQVEETQYDENKEAYVKASQPDVKNNESLPAAQKRQTPGQLITPVTPRTRTERAETPTPPLGPAPSLPTQFPDPQSPSQESDDVRSEHSDDGPKEGHPKREMVELHTLPKFDWDGLEAEYFAAMDRANEVEAELSEEFKVLANVRVLSHFDLPVHQSDKSYSISLNGPTCRLQRTRRGP